MQSTIMEENSASGEIGVSTGTSKSNLTTDIPELLHQPANHADDIRDVDADLETARLLATWNAELIVENKVSEPRDILMTERTTLSWLKFSIVLIVASVAVFLNYRIETDKSESNTGNGNGNGNKNFRDSTVYATTIGLLFAALSLVGTICSAINYYKAIRNYASDKIATFDSRITTVFFSVCITTLIAINIALMIKSD